MTSPDTATKEQRRADTQNSLMRAVADELLAKMEEEPTALRMQLLAFQYWSKAHNQEMQVHILVTRDTNDFMEPFATLEYFQG